MKHQLSAGDIVIRRVSNGWAATIIEEDPEIEILSVFEDAHEQAAETSNVGADSLERLLYEMFESYFQSKYTGGLVTSVRQYGRAHDPEEM